MSGKLLDTNAVIALQNGDTAFLKLIEDNPEILLPAPVVAELYYGAYNSSKVDENIKVIERLVSENTILNCDADTGKLWGQIRRQLKVKGRPIPENDIWIAAIALQYNLILITNDEHFSEVKNLKTETW